VGKWLKQPFFDFSQGLLPNMLEPKFLKTTYMDHMNDKSDNRAFLWNYWLLKTWYPNG